MNYTGMISLKNEYSKRLGAYPASYIDEILKLASSPGILSFAGGLPDPAFFPAGQLALSFQEVLRSDTTRCLQYNITEGFLPLRQYIADRFSAAHSCVIEASQVLITQGAQQGLDLIGRAFIDENDFILIENPTFIGALQAFAPYFPSYLTIEQEDDGIDVDSMLSQLKRYETAKLFYTMPRFQNPTGCSYSSGKRDWIVRSLEGHPLWIVEDDAYGELKFDACVSKPFICDRPDRSIYIGSFSKSIAPALRLGWVIAPEPLIERLTILKRAMDTFGNFTTQLAVYHYLSRFDFNEQVRTISEAYRSRRDCMIGHIQSYFPGNV